MEKVFLLFLKRVWKGLIIIVFLNIDVERSSYKKNDVFVGVFYFVNFFVIYIMCFKVKYEIGWRDGDEKNFER